jgi:subfamily B ATP-binding cassette protein MsbA
LKKKTLVGRLAAYLKPYITGFTLGQVVMVISLAAGVVLPLIIRDMLDLKGSVLTNIAILGGLTLISGLANYVKDILLGRVSNSIIVDLRTSLYGHLQKKSLDYYNNNNSGEIVSSMTNDINLFQETLSTGLTWFLQMLLSFVAIVVIMFSMDWMLSLVLTISFPLIMLTTRILGKPVKEISARAQENLSEVTGTLNQSVNGISVIKSFSLENFAARLFLNRNKEWLNNVTRQVKIKARTNMFVHLLNMGQIILMLGFGVWRISQGHMTVGALTAFIMYAQSLAGPLGMISQIYVDIQRAFSAVRRIFKIMDEDNMISEEDQAEELNDVKGEIVFNDVDFSYSRNEKVLKGTTLTIPAGRTVAFVGSSGAGKSTLMNLIPRFYDVRGGKIEIDGKDIRTLTKKSLRSHIAIVPQSTYLFDMTIKENIACGRVDACDEEIVEAAKKANAHDFIMAMPRGYDTHTGEGGVLLSGGQKQRLAIARAFLKGSEILLLDEATSALDNISEKLVQDAIQKLMKGRTTLIVAHRLSTIVDADIIYVMDSGKVVDQGNHGELMEASAVYRRIYQASLGKSEREEQPA